MHNSQHPPPNIANRILLSVFKVNICPCLFIVDLIGRSLYLCIYWYYFLIGRVIAAGLLCLREHSETILSFHISKVTGFLNFTLCALQAEETIYHDPRGQKISQRWSSEAWHQLPSTASQFCSFYACLIQLPQQILGIPNPVLCCQCFGLGTSVWQKKNSKKGKS